MESRTVAALACSLVSQALLLFLLLPSASPLLLPNPTPPQNPLLHHHFLSLLHSSKLAASRKRKRDEDSPDQLPPSNPDEFPLFFRMTASSFEFLSGLLEPLLLDSPDTFLLSPKSILAVALFRLSTGCSYEDLAFRFGVSVSAARFCSRRLCRVLCTNFRFYLAFPNDGPTTYCRGSIVPMRFRTPDRCPVFAHVVAGPNRRIFSITVTAGGDHWTALRCSSLCKDAKKVFGSSGRFVVGGPEYPLLSWLMVPFAEAKFGSVEDDFNALHCKLMRPGLRTAASLRGWGILKSGVVDESRKMAVAFVGTCAILHNMLLQREDYSAMSDGVEKETLDRESCGVGKGVFLEESRIEEEAGLVLRIELANKAREKLKTSNVAG